MSKVSSVLVVAKAPLRFLPPDVVYALDRVLFQWFEGADAQHTRRWGRMWRRMFHSKEARPSLHLWLDVERSRPFHARWMAIEERIFESGQEGFYNLGGFRYWLKTGAAFGTYVATSAGLVFEPSSLSWEDCSDDEMREFTEDALAFLRTPHALATLWPHVAEPRREDMLEACLPNPNEENHEPASTH